MKAITTQAELVTALVAMGMDQAFAKATGNEWYNHGDLAHAHLLTRSNVDEGETVLEAFEDFVVVSIDTQEILEATFNSGVEMLTLNSKGICVDGELLFDQNGDYL